MLVTGPTGSGKTTTLYAAMNEVNSPEKTLITVEDPVEYELEGVKQVQVHQKSGLTFASGLRSLVRADPDVIMVGEVRDAETARLAIESALTGHLVLTTLHTNDAAARGRAPGGDGHRAVPGRRRDRVRGGAAARAPPVRRASSR